MSELSFLDVGNQRCYVDPDVERGFIPDFDNEGRHVAPFVTDAERIVGEYYGEDDYPRGPHGNREAI